MYTNKQNRRLKSQITLCTQILNYILNQVLIERKPLDKVLSLYFRKNKKIGARDRRFLMEVSFSMFRWFGWIRKVLSSELNINSDKCEGSIKISETKLEKIIIFILLIDVNNEFETLKNFLLNNHKLRSRKVNKNEIASNKNFINKAAEVFREVFCVKNELSTIELIPEWSVLKLYFPISKKEKIIESLQKRPPIWIRVQSDNIRKMVLQLENKSIQAICHSRIQNAVKLLNPRTNLYNLEEFKKGSFELQDLASQIIGLICFPEQGEKWWDACAGAGGKTLQLASMMNNKGRITSTDIQSYKLETLKRRAKRAKFSNILCREWNGKSISKKKNYFYDGVLVDAPCSCSGTWRRRPDARWKLLENEADKMPDIQKQLLRSASKGVKVGGILVYATCSLFLEENQDVIKEFLNERKDFTLEEFTDPISGGKVDGMLQVFPQENDSDATFTARLRRISK